MKKQQQTNGPTLAEGIDTEDELLKNANEQEISNGDSTKVFTLSLDENDPS